MRNEINATAQRELMTKMTEKCFSKCTNHKGEGKLDRNEQMCLGMCIDRYTDCMAVGTRRPTRNDRRKTSHRARPSQAVNQALVERQNMRS